MKSGNVRCWQARGAASKVRYAGRPGNRCKPWECDLSFLSRVEDACGLWPRGLHLRVITRETCAERKDACPQMCGAALFVTAGKVESTPPSIKRTMGRNGWRLVPQESEYAGAGGTVLPTHTRFVNILLCLLYIY